MNDFLKVLLIAGGAFAVYEIFFANHATAPPQTPANPSTTTTTNTATTATTKDLVAAAAAALGYGPGSVLTSDQWCFFLSQARGTPCPALTWPQPAGYKYTIDEWWSFISQNGVSGLGGNYAYRRYLRGL